MKTHYDIIMNRFKENYQRGSSYWDVDFQENTNHFFTKKNGKDDQHIRTFHYEKEITENLPYDLKKHDGTFFTMDSNRNEFAYFLYFTLNKRHYILEFSIDNLEVEGHCNVDFEEMFEDAFDIPDTQHYLNDACEKILRFTETFLEISKSHSKCRLLFLYKDIDIFYSDALIEVESI